MDTENQFRPLKVCVKPIVVSADGSLSEGIAIVAEDANGHYRGIGASTEIAALLDEFLPTSGPRFLEFWSTYEADRGGDCFFWDLRRLVDAIAASPDLPELRKLTGAKSSNDLMHNAYQAHMMAIAHRQYPGGVSLLRAGGRAKSADFLLKMENGAIPCEVKTITRRNVIDLLDDGLQISEIDRRVFVDTLDSKIREALAQTGSQGLVIVAVSCDSLGMVLGKTLTHWERVPERVFVPGSVVITCRDDGLDRYFSFSIVDAPSRLAELRTRLDETLPPPFSIPLTSSAISVANGTDWMAAGRVVAINNRMTPLEYTDDQLAHYRSGRPFGSVPIGRLLLWRARWRLAEVSLKTYLLPNNRLEQRQYRLDELLEHPGGLALIHWLACLRPCIHDAFEADEAASATLTTGVLHRDYQLTATAMREIGAAFWRAPDAAYVGTLVKALVSDRQTFAAMKRLTIGYGKLLQEELALREAEMS